MSKITDLLFVFLLCTVLCVSPVSAKVLKVPSEHPTIDAALGVASDGDTILIARGTYEHTSLNINKRLTLASDYINTKDQIDIDETIIEATPAAGKQWFALNSKDSRIGKLGTEGLLKNVRLLRRCAPRNDRSATFMSLRAIRRIARQSQVSRWDFFNSPTDPCIDM